MIVRPRDIRAVVTHVDPMISLRAGWVRLLVRAFSVSLLALACCDAEPQADMQRADTLPRELAWVGLFNAELVDWLHNGGRLAQLCTSREHSDDWYRCRTAMLEPKAAVIAVRAEPRLDARRLGQMVVVALPDKGLRVFAGAGSETTRFTPDLFDADWGYGPWFHQSILARRGSWLLIPVPSVGEGWIDASDLGGPGDPASNAIVTVRKGDIVTTPRGDMFVLGVENSVLRVRTEQVPDMWCQAGDPPPLAPWQEIRIPFEELFDSRRHLLISYKYTRGC